MGSKWHVQHGAVLQVKEVSPHIEALDNGDNTGASLGGLVLFTCLTMEGLVLSEPKSMEGSPDILVYFDGPCGAGVLAHVELFGFDVNILKYGHSFESRPNRRWHLPIRSCAATATCSAGEKTLLVKAQVPMARMDL